MIEYIYDIIMATSGEQVAAKITDDAGAVVREQCYFHLFQEGEMKVEVSGLLVDDVWYFAIPDIAPGRYDYCFGTADKALCFKKPFYLK